MQPMLESHPVVVAPTAISPARLAHVVLRSSQFQALVDWYLTVLNAKIAFSDGATWLFSPTTKSTTVSPC